MAVVRGDDWADPRQTGRESPRRVYVGIDPGASGGMAALLPDGTVRFAQMPEMEEWVWVWVRDIVRFSTSNGWVIKVAMEEVTGYIPKADTEGGEKKGQPGSRMFNFGWSYGGLRMALLAAGLMECRDWVTVRPQKWQSGIISHRKRGESKAAWKGRLKAVAQGMFPRLKVTLATADALLIAHWCKKEYGDK